MDKGKLTSGSEVEFRLTSVVCPDMHTLFEQMTEERQVRGRIVFLSDYGQLRDHFAIIEVEGIIGPVIVPVSKLKTRAVEQAESTDEQPSHELPVD